MEEFFDMEEMMLQGEDLESAYHLDTKPKQGD